MTAVTSYFGMPALKRKTTCFGMVKGCLFPVFRLVALFAIPAKPAIMMIIELMAGITIRRNALVMLVGVAHRTFNSLVRSCQRKIRFPCVVEFSFLPGRFLMTIATVLAQTALVAVIILVTAKAVGRCLAKQTARRVTVFTGKLCVNSFKRKIGKAMVESLGIQPDNVCFPPLVFLVTGGAFHIPRWFEPPVEPRAGCQVLIYTLVLMAGQTQITLQGFGKRRVAFTAIRLEIGMSRTDRPGHDQRLNGC